MKAKKIVIGAVSAAMLSLSVCSIAPIFAAGETVQISVGKVEAKAGETFSVDVSLANVPSSGIQCCDFAIKYDSSLVTIDSVEAGELANTAAVKDDPSAAMLSIFDSIINNEKGITSMIWSTALNDVSYWMNGDGVFCTVKGTVSADAKGSIPIEIVPASRDSSGTPNEVISVGYFQNKEAIRYNVETSAGSVTVGDSGETTTAPSTSASTTGENPTSGENYKKGDANEDGNINIADAVLIMQSISNPSEYKVSKQGVINSDVIGNDGITNMDALEIQKYEAKLPSALDE